MKRLFAALAVGLALGFAPAHQYAGLDPRLNQNVIDGMPTVVCTTDPQLFEVLTDAIAAWNQALLSLAVRTDGNQPPLILHQTPPDGRSANCNATTPLRYNAYDTADEATAAGSYAFLSDSGDATSTVATYEGLRDGTAKRLLIHKTDAQGVSRATLYDAVTAGDFFEWREADDCWVRYRVTEVLPDPPGAAPRKLLTVEWTTYAFAGCSGAITANTAVTFDWGPLPDLGGVSLTTPIRHGPFQIAPEGWEGPVEEDPFRPWPGNSYNNPVATTDLAEARRLPHWRDPTLPSGWTLSLASSGDPSHDPPYGYCAGWANDRGYGGVEICGGFYPGRDQPWESSRNAGRAVVETRTIAARPAIVVYSPAGPNHNRFRVIEVWAYDPIPDVVYNVMGSDWTLNGSNVDAVIAIARSLFEN